MPHSTSKSIFLAPSPRIVSDIFDENDLLRLRGVGEVVIHEGGPVTDAGNGNGGGEHGHGHD